MNETGNKKWHRVGRGQRNGAGLDKCSLALDEPSPAELTWKIVMNKTTNVTEKQKTFKNTDTVCNTVRYRSAANMHQRCELKQVAYSIMHVMSCIQ